MPGIDDSAIPDAQTRGELARVRDLNGGSWEGAAVAPRPNGNGLAPRLCAGGCGTSLTGRPEQKWCSTACRKRAQRKATGTGPVAAPLSLPVTVAGNVESYNALSEVLGAVFAAGGVLEFNAGGLVIRAVGPPLLR